MGDGDGEGEGQGGRPMEVEEVPVEEFELDESNPEEMQKYNTPVSTIIIIYHLKWGNVETKHSHFLFEQRFFLHYKTS